MQSHTRSSGKREKLFVLKLEASSRNEPRAAAFRLSRSCPGAGAAQMRRPLPSGWNRAELPAALGSRVSLSSPSEG